MNKIETITGRDGTVSVFCEDKIAQAIYAASVDAGEEVEVETIVRKVVGKLSKEPTVEEVQDAVVHALLVSKYKKTGEAFVGYRALRNEVREGKSTLSSSLNSVLARDDEGLMFENGNLDSKTITTQRTLLIGEVGKAYADKILPKDVVLAHENGEVHFHDKQFNPMQPYTNCALVDLKYMLQKGFKLGGASIAPPKSGGVSTAVAAQVIAQVSSAMYGGTSLANIDQVIAPYVTLSYNKNVEKGEKYKVEDVELFAKETTIKEVYDAFQGLEYEINSLFNSHAQSPFTTISFGMGTSWEEREIQKAILEVRLKGLGENGITAIFPKLIMFMEEGVNMNPEDPNYDIKQLALKCAARRQYPDIISAKNNRDITGSSVPVTSMG